MDDFPGAESLDFDDVSIVDTKYVIPGGDCA